MLGCQALRIVLVAGELSGDNLGAGLIRALRERWPNARFEGIGGERMIAQGFESLFPLETLAVMGLMEVLRHLPALVRIRRALYRRVVADPPAVFIGIDAPDFNLPLERCLRAKGITTVHYVSPQIWAWRQWRVRKILRSVDLMLALLPFEVDFYRQHGLPVSYVGHPLADEIPLRVNRCDTRCGLGIAAPDTHLVALLPGSRMAEVRRLGPPFLAAARWLQQRCPELHFVLPAATPAIAEYLRRVLAEDGRGVSTTLLQGRARDALMAADVALVASGTATLEALLSRCPMVVAYRVAPLSAWIATRLIEVPWYSLPNLLAGKELAPEFIQEAVTVENLAQGVLALLNDPGRRARVEGEYDAIHEQLRCNGNQRAAVAIAKLLGR